MCRLCPLFLFVALCAQIAYWLLNLDSLSTTFPASWLKQIKNYFPIDHVACESLFLKNQQIGIKKLHMQQKTWEASFRNVWIQPDFSYLHYNGHTAKHQIFFTQGQIKSDLGILENLTGRLTIECDSYQIHVHATFKGHTLFIHSEPLSKVPIYLEKSLKKLSQEIPESIISPQIEPSKIYISLQENQASIYVGTSQLAFKLDEKPIVAKGIKAEFDLSPKAIQSSLTIENVTYKDFLAQNLTGSFNLDSAFHFLNVKTQATILHPSLPEPVQSFIQVPQIQAKTKLQLYLNNDKVDLCGQISTSQKKLQEGHFWGFFKENFVHHFLQQQPYFKLQNYPIDCNQPLFINVQYKPDCYAVQFTNKSPNVADFSFNSIQGSIKFFTSQKTLSWNTHFIHEQSNFKTSGYQDFQNSTGQLYLKGTLDPRLTYFFKEFLPDWWWDFWEPFTFHKDFPHTHCQLNWDAHNKMRNRGLGSVNASNFAHNDLHFKQLALSFGYLPGYTQLNLKPVQLNSGEGQGQLDWLYSYDEESPEGSRIQFSAKGTYKQNDWIQLIQTFYPQFSQTDKIPCSLEGPIQADLQGILAENFKKDPTYIETCFQSHSMQCFNLNIDRSSAHVRWTPTQIEVKKLDGFLNKTAPINGQLTFTFPNHLQFSLSGKQMDTGFILPNLNLLESWYQDIPEENRLNYQGMLDLDFSGIGQWGNLDSFKGNGSLSYTNPQLAKIHLMGSLFQALPKKLRILPSIDFNTFQGTFQLEDGLISTKGANLLGPSTKAELNGQLNLIDKSLRAHLTFSFLDAKQIKLPFIKQLLFVFRPIMKGFSAQVTGTFQNPNWMIFFNPLRFITK